MKTLLQILLFVGLRNNLSIGEDTNERVFEKRCGDCWCIFDPSNNETCPAFTEGYYDSFPSIYSTFQLVDPNNTSPKLLSENGEDCYPYTYLGQPDIFATFEESRRPQCAAPNMSNVEDAVCGYLFESNVTDIESCTGRRYRMKTYKSLDTLNADGAVLTHYGACGVCSNAQDLSVFGNATSGPKLDESSRYCGSSYFVKQLVDSPTAFLEAIACFETIGFTNQCSMLWANTVATVSKVCVNECSASDVPFNGDPPQCEQSDCIKCTFGQVQRNDFTILSGFNYTNGGLTQEVPQPCRSFRNVLRDPCDGVVVPNDVASESEQAATNLATMTGVVGLEKIIVCGFVVLATLVLH